MTKEFKLGTMWILKWLIPLVMICSAMVYGLRTLVVVPEIDCKIRPLKHVVLENNYMLKEIVPVEAQKKAIDKVETIKRLEK